MNVEEVRISGSHGSAECKYEFTNFAHEVTLHNNLAYLS